MILIIGGAFQGKKDLAFRLAAEAADGTSESAGKAITKMDGSREDLSEGRDCRILLHYHAFIRNYIKDHPEADRETVRALARSTVSACPRAVITMDEVGCGVVPMDREERAYRDAAGTAGQELARLADRVIRVMAGIPVRIK